MVSALALLFGSAAHLSAQFSLINVGHVQPANGGYVYDVAISGHYAYLAGVYSGLLIYDVSNPTNPVIVGETNSLWIPSGFPPLPLQHQGLAVSGNHVYLADDYDGLRIYDVSNPIHPLDIGHANSSIGFNNAMAANVAISGNYAVLVSAYYGGGGFDIYDISNPANPIDIGHNATNFGAAYDVAVSGNFAFVANGIDGLHIYEISNPDNPIDISHTNNSAGNALGITLQGNYAFVAHGAGGLCIYDISNPLSPIYISSVNMGGPPRGVVVSDNYAYVANSGDGLRVYDVSDPANPANVGHANDGGYARRVAVSGGYVYLANDLDGLRVYLPVSQSSVLGLTRAVPRLSVGLSSTNTVIVSWPVPPTPGLGLQQNSDLTTANWLDVTNTPVVINNRNQVVFPLSDVSQQFRLKYQ